MPPESDIVREPRRTRPKSRRRKAAPAALVEVSPVAPFLIALAAIAASAIAVVAAIALNRAQAEPSVVPSPTASPSFIEIDLGEPASSSVP